MDYVTRFFSKFGIEGDLMYAFDMGANSFYQFLYDPREKIYKKANLHECKAMLEGILENFNQSYTEAFADAVYDGRDAVFTRFSNFGSDSTSNASLGPTGGGRKSSGTGSVRERLKSKG